MRDNGLFIVFAAERWSSVAAFVAEKPHLRKPAAYLEALCADKDFNDFLNAAICSFSQRSPGAANVPLRADDVKRCIKQLYHSPSKDHHGASPGQLLISPDAVKYKADVAAACLLLEYQRTPYTYQDSTGATVPTPFDTQSIEKKIPAFLTVAAEQSSQ